MRLPLLAPATALLTVGALVATAAPAAAAPLTAYEMPFPCSQSWTGTTRPSHSPSSKAIDWNRPDDVGDPVVASAAGVVATAVPDGTRGYGRYVVVDHGNGESTLYAHLQRVDVGVGQSVDQGAPLGLVGDTGNSTGPHLHFEERLNGTVVTPYFHGTQFVFDSALQSQNCPDVPLAGNFVGDRVAELAVFDRGTATFKIRGPNGPIKVRYGKGTDQPLAGDWDGDGRVNVGVRRPSERQFYLSTPGGSVRIVMGNRTDLPVAGDWDGDGLWDIGVRKASKNVFRLRRTDGTSFGVTLGRASHIPVTGDWNGDGKTDLGVYDPTRARFTLRLQDESGLVWLTRVTYGSPGDLPVTGDWDGNGKTDLGVWTPSTAKFSQRIASSVTTAAKTSVTTAYGRARG
jgi:murein DD-endopeptidase MepM/ murein hydrolase activator NlpD